MKYLLFLFILTYFYSCSEEKLEDDIALCEGITCSEHGDCKIVRHKAICDCYYRYDSFGPYCYKIPIIKHTSINIMRVKQNNEFYALERVENTNNDINNGYDIKVIDAYDKVLLRKRIFLSDNEHNVCLGALNMLIDSLDNIYITFRDINKVIMIKLDSEFNIIWKKKYDNINDIRSVLIDSDGNIILIADIYNNHNTAGSFFKINARNGDILLNMVNRFSGMVRSTTIDEYGNLYFLIDEFCQSNKKNCTTKSIFIKVDKSNRQVWKREWSKDVNFYYNKIISYKDKIYLINSDSVMIFSPLGELISNFPISYSSYYSVIHNDYLYLISSGFSMEKYDLNGKRIFYKNRTFPEGAVGYIGFLFDKIYLLGNDFCNQNILMVINEGEDL